MAFIDRVRSNLAKVAAVTGIPAGIVAAEDRAGMDNTTPLGPGTPIAPSDGFSTVPRAQDYRSGYNIAGKPRINSAVSFPTMRALIDAYDVAQICITHRIDSLRSYAWNLRPMPGITDDMSEAIALAHRILSRPDPADPDMGFGAWLQKYLWDVFAFDAGTLYRVRNRAGGVIGLRVIDGTTIAPLLDAWGNKPGYDFETKTWAPAYIQYVQGMTWDWLTVRDLIYAPYRPISNTPYGRAPIETVLLNANTDIRFQVYFMQRFTAGNIPEGFGVSPENWTPDQIEQWQAKWDALLQGDQEILSQIKWVPAGTSFEFPNKQEFKSEFSVYLMRKTAAAFHVSPNEIGFTEDVNRSTGETQVGVQERVGDLPMMRHLEGILTRFLQDDLNLPLEFVFDTGNDDLDNLALAQSDKVYVDMGAVSASDIAEMRFGIIDDAGQKVPRFVMTPQGPLPLSTLGSMSAPTDSTGAPKPGTVVPGSIDPTKTRAVGGAGAAEALPAAEEPVELVQVGKSAAPLALEAGHTAERAELAQFARFAKARRRAGVWRPFTFEHVDHVHAHRLNVAGYGEILKANGECTHAGLAVVAVETGRVLMLQRGLDEDDPNGGLWELPGGGIEPGETPQAAAFREWSEEVGAPIPDGILAEDWVAPSGLYAGFVLIVEDESCVLPHSREGGLINPDDPDGDAVEAVAWFDPAQLVNNPAVRPALSADVGLLLAAVSAAVKRAPKDDAEWLAQRVGDALDGNPGKGIPPIAEVVAEAFDEALGGDAAPFVKAGWRDDSAHAPQHEFDVVLTDHYAPRIEAALLELAGSLRIDEAIADAAALLPEGAVSKADDTQTREAMIRRAMTALAAGEPLEQPLREVLGELYGEAWATGAHAAEAQLGAHAVTVGPDGAATVDVDWDAWTPGDPIAVGEVAAGAMRQNLAKLGITVKGITDTVLDTIGNQIGDGLLAGHPSAKIARQIREAVGSRSRAERIAHTEVARAQTSASMLVYGQSGVTQYDVLTSDGACPKCLAIAAAGPYALDDDRGRVPIHPWCRCADSPRTDSIDPDRIGTINPDGTPYIGDDTLLPANVTVSAKRSGVTVYDTPTDSPSTDGERLRNDLLGYSEFAGSRTAGRGGVSLDEHLRNAKNVADSFTRDAEVAIMVHPEVLPKIVKSGRYKSQFETGTSGGAKGAKALEARAALEEAWFGYRADAPAQSRPVYGFLRTSVASGQTSRAYGDAHIVLREGVRDRTTWTVGDSMGAMGSTYPGKLGDASRWTAAEAPVGREADYLREKSETWYLEAQIHGGVSVDDIARVEFAKAPSQEVADALASAGIEWRTRGAS